MSALNVTQEEAGVLVESLKMFAKVHENASGVVPDEVAVLLAKLAPEPVVEAPAQEPEQPQVEVSDEVVADVVKQDEEE